MSFTVSLPRVFCQPQKAVSRPALPPAQECEEQRAGLSYTWRGHHWKVQRGQLCWQLSLCVCAQGVTTKGDTSLTLHMLGKHSHTSQGTTEGKSLCSLLLHLFTAFLQPQMGTRRNLLVQPLLSKNVHFSQIVHLLCSPLHVFPAATGLDTSHPNIFKLSSTPAQAHLELFDL